MADRTFQNFKPIRNKLRTFLPDSVLSLAIAKLHELREFPAEKIRFYPPWVILLIIKWTVLCGDFGDYTLRRATPRDLDRLVNMTHKVFDGIQFPTDPFIFMKNMAFQQLWLQRKVNSADLGRQVLLFEELPTNPYIEETFCRLTGIKLSDFLELSLGLATWLLTDNKPYIDRSYFHTIEGSYPAQTIDRFLGQLSLDSSSLKPFLQEEDERIQNFEFKLFEQTPLKKRPLFRVGTQYFCYSPNVLHASLSTIVYDMLKEHDPAPFSENFGKCFEKYVKLGLDYSGIKFIEENELKRLFPDMQVVDFLLPCPDSNVLIESKAIELSPLARVSPDPGVIGRNLRDSVIKTVKQGISVASRLTANSPVIPGVVSSPRDTFLLVATFKDLHLGNGKTFFRGPNKEEIDKYVSEKGLTGEILPFENIYFLSISEFEWLVYVLKYHQISLPELLRTIVELDSSSGKKFQFGQHLQSQFNDIRLPEYVVERYDSLAARLEKNCYGKIDGNKSKRWVWRSGPSIGFARGPYGPRRCRFSFLRGRFFFLFRVKYSASGSSTAGKLSIYDKSLPTTSSSIVA